MSNLRRSARTIRRPGSVAWRRWCLALSASLILIIIPAVQWLRPDSKVVISNRTTFITEPLTATGELDYLTWMEDRLTATGATNSEWRALWPWIRASQSMSPELIVYANGIFGTRSKPIEGSSSKKFAHVARTDPLAEFADELNRFIEEVHDEDAPGADAVYSRNWELIECRQQVLDLGQYCANTPWQASELPAYAAYLAERSEELDCFLAACESGNSERLFTRSFVLPSGVGREMLGKLIVALQRYGMKSVYLCVSRVMLHAGSQDFERAISELNALTRLVRAVGIHRGCDGLWASLQGRVEQGYVRVLECLHEHDRWDLHGQLLNPFTLDKPDEWASEKALADLRLQLLMVAGSQALRLDSRFPDRRDRFVGGFDKLSSRQQQLLQGSVDPNVVLRDINQLLDQFARVDRNPSVLAGTGQKHWQETLEAARDRLEGGWHEYLGFIARGRRSRLYSDVVFVKHVAPTLRRWVMGDSYFANRQLRRSAGDVVVYRARNGGQWPQRLEDLAQGSVTITKRDQQYLDRLEYERLDEGGVLRFRPMAQSTEEFTWQWPPQQTLHERVQAVNAAVVALRDRYELELAPVRLETAAP